MKGIFLLLVVLLTILLLPAVLLAAEPGAGIDFGTAIGYLAPLMVIGLTQLLKIWIQSRWAPLIVLILGGTAALLNVGPSPGTEYIDTTVNAGYVSGVAALVYDLVKKLTKRPAE